MGDLLNILAVLAVMGIPSLGIIILFYKYEAEYVKNILFLFFITMVCHWGADFFINVYTNCLLYTSPSPRDGLLSRMPSSA